MNEATLLPLIFAALMALALLVYAILDGYDLGIGILLPADNEAQRDKMIASIGPFWDANETWLVLAIGILLVAFPKAHSIVFSHLYLPTTALLLGLIMRGVAFDFRAKAIIEHKRRWDLAFKFGSLLSALAQGYMLGHFVTGFRFDSGAYGFAILSAVCVSAAYAMIGAAWLLMKTEGELQKRAARWGRACIGLTALGIASVAVVHPLINERVYDKWFQLPELLLLIPIPVLCFGLLILMYLFLRHAPYRNDAGCWFPFAGSTVVFFLCFQALSYSFYPYIVPDSLTIWDAASAPESLQFLLFGAIPVLPTILAYTIFSYRIFWGKAGDLHYH